MDIFRKWFSTVKINCSMNSISHKKPVENVGILGLEIYFPRNYITQEDLEKVIFLSFFFFD